MLSLGGGVGVVGRGNTGEGHKGRTGEDIARAGGGQLGRDGAEPDKAPATGQDPGAPGTARGLRAALGPLGLLLLLPAHPARHVNEDRLVVLVPVALVARLLDELFLRLVVQFSRHSYTFPFLFPPHICIHIQYHHATMQSAAYIQGKESADSRGKEGAPNSKCLPVCYVNVGTGKS